MPSLRRMQIDQARLGQTFYRAPTAPDEQRDPERAGAMVSEHFAISRHRMAEYAAPEAAGVATTSVDAQPFRRFRWTRDDGMNMPAHKDRPLRNLLSRISKNVLGR